MGMEEKRDIGFTGISASDRRRFDKDKAYQRFLTRTGKAGEWTGRKKTGRIVWQSAAAIAVLIMVSYASFIQGGKNRDIQYAEIQVEAPWGSQVKTVLPDGTLVWLNADSKLTYSQAFGVDERKVYLSGEGYFEVTRNEKLPFNVQTDGLQVNVHGTKFNLRNYSGDREATVHLFEGKVSVDNYLRPDEGIAIDPNQKIFLDKKNGNMRLTQVKANNFAKWTSGNLYFDEELISDIAKDLERSYDVNIIIHPDLENARFYGSFIRKELSIRDVLDRLASTGKMKYSMTGNEIVLSAK